MNQSERNRAVSRRQEIRRNGEIILDVGSIRDDEIIRNDQEQRIPNRRRRNNDGPQYHYCDCCVDHRQVVFLHPQCCAYAECRYPPSYEMAVVPVYDLRPHDMRLEEYRGNHSHINMSGSHRDDDPADYESREVVQYPEQMEIEEPIDTVDPLSRTNTIFGGVIRDIHFRIQWYSSDYSDGFNWHCCSAIIYTYFATVPSAITFGGLYADKTFRAIGVPETLLFSSLGGIIFSILSGQPLLIVGVTGPLLMLDKELAVLFVNYGYDFLGVRLYSGIWVYIIALLVAAVEGSVVIKSITRFTEDIYAFFVAALFLIEPFVAIWNIYLDHPSTYIYSAKAAVRPGHEIVNMSSNDTHIQLLPDNQYPDVGAHPNTALFNTILALGTFLVLKILGDFSKEIYLNRRARRVIRTLRVPLSILLMVLMSRLLSVHVDTLHIPSGFSPTATDRFWFVPLNENVRTIPIWLVFASIIPGLMTYIIIFMETHIAALIIDKPQRKLKKGCGYHMDILLIAAINVLCGFFGAPWLSVAVVRSISHVASVTVMTDNSRTLIDYVHEQRVTALVVSILMGLSMLMTDWVNLIPMAVLFGVFMYMGSSSLKENQLWCRTKLLVKSLKYQTHLIFVRHVKVMKIHLFTCIQLVALLLLLIVNFSFYSMALPFFLILCIPLRMMMGKLFTGDDLVYLDNEELYL